MDGAETVSECRTTCGLELSEIVYAPNVLDPLHVHKEAHFQLGLDGTCTEFYQDNIWKYRRFSAGFLPPDHSHSVHYGESGFRLFRVVVSERCLERVNIRPTHLSA